MGTAPGLLTSGSLSPQQQACVLWKWGLTADQLTLACSWRVLRSGDLQRARLPRLWPLPPEMCQASLAKRTWSSGKCGPRTCQNMRQMLPRVWKKTRPNRN